MSGFENKEKYYEDLIDEIRADYQKRREERREMESKWKLCAEYLTGSQNGKIGANGEVEDVGRSFFWQANECYNHIAPIMETRISKLHNVNTAISVRPQTSDKEDIEAAKFATRIIRTATNASDLGSLMSRAITWSETTGTAFYKLGWDINLGKIIASEDEKSIKTGDICINVCSPYEIFPDNPKVESMSGQRSIIHAKSYSVDEVELAYGVRVIPEKKENGGGAKKNNLIGSAGKISALFAEEEERENCVTVIERYAMPTKKNPKGRLEIIAGDKVLFVGELPFSKPNGEKFLPFVKQACVEKDTFFGSTIIERIIPVQRAYNAVKNRKHEMLSRIATGIVAVEDGSVDVDSLEQEGLAPGKILVYRQGSEVPRMLEIGKIPTDYYREESNLLSEFTMISGVSELMQYTGIPNNMTSGIAISLLIEQDDSKLLIAASGIRKAMREIGKMILAIYKCMATGLRLDLIAGDSGDVEKKYWTGSDISADDVVFDTESEVINSPSSRKNMIYELLKLGLLTDEKGGITDTNKLKILEILGLGNWESIKSNAELHQKKAAKENIEMEKGREAVVNIYDDHDLHTEEHITMLIGSGLSKKAEQALTAHISDHRSAKIISGAGTEQQELPKI